jgi:hypothetical protein
MRVANGVVNQAQSTAAVADAALALSTREVREVAIHSRIGSKRRTRHLFPGPADGLGLPEAALADVTGRVTTAMFDRLQPYNQRGLQAYFNFTDSPAHFRDSRWM